MKIISKISKFLPILFLVAVLQSCSNDDDNNSQQLNIVETAIATPQLSSLVAALERTGLTSVLNGSGPFTVLAPTNEAFATLLNGASLESVPVPVLTEILLNHVIAGNVTSTNLTTAGSGYTSTSATGPGGNNLSLYFNTTTADGVEFNNVSSVIAADISATNGTVHIVDAVIGLPTVVDFALANPALSNLVAALQLADSQNPSPDLIPTLQGAGPFTVFAPTDAAFAALSLELDPSGTTELGDLDPALVQSVLTYHVVSGNVTSSQLSTGPVTTLGGTIDANATNFTLTDPNDRVSNIITTLVNIQARNGVVHAIDKVILPPL